MRDVSREWIAYTNQRKQALEVAREKEHKAEAVPLQQLEKSEVVRLPKLVAQPVERVANVNYSVSVARMTKLKRGFGGMSMSYRDVGWRSFNYAYRDFVGED